MDQHVTLATYDSGSKWYVTHYDLDGTWGMHCSYNYGDVSPTCKFPDGYVGQTEGILWGKVKRALKDDVKELYSSLRTDVLTYENIYKKFTDFFKMIPQKEYDDDKIINPGIYKTDTKESIQNWIKQRLEYIDDFILNDATEVLPHEFAYGYLNNSITEFALYDNEEIWMPIKYWAVSATKVNIKFESEDTSILQTDHHVLKGVAPGETRILGICEDKPTVTKNLKVKVVPHIFYENDNIIKDRLKFWLDARDFNMEDNTILDRTGLNKIIVNGNPTKINNTLIFDGEDDYLKINYLGYKLKYSKNLIEVWISYPVKQHTCPCCKHGTSRVHDYYLRSFNHIKVGKRVTKIYYNQRRYLCTNCGKRFAENNSFIEKFYSLVSHI